MRASAFGESAADLALDFDATPQPALVSRLLGLHLHPDAGAFSESDVWEWSLPRRTQGLLAIMEASCGSRLDLDLRCPARDCAEFLELELDTGMFRRPPPAEAGRCLLGSGEEVELRLPTGADQRAWLGRLGSGDAEDWREMARSLVLKVDGERPAAGWSVPEPWLEALGSALEEVDPVTALRLETVCPSCSQTVALELDLEDLLLRRLAERRERTLEQVHRLAWAYHWSEADILSLTPSRRADYLARIRREADE